MTERGAHGASGERAVEDLRPQLYTPTLDLYFRPQLCHRAAAGRWRRHGASGVGCYYEAAGLRGATNAGARLHGFSFA